MTGIPQYVFSRKALTWLSLAWGIYVIVRQAALFSLTKPPLFATLHSYPSRVLVTLCALCAAGMLVRAVREGNAGITLQWAGRVIFLLSVVLIAAGLWTSVYTHFEGDVIRAEGQSFSGFPNEYVPETMFTASPRALPQIGMTILNVRPQETGRDLSLAGVLVNVLFGGRTSERVLERTLDSSRPLFSDWTFVSVTDFGYAVDYALLNPSERELESQTLSLGTYPPGAEDVFEAVFMGYQFHVSVFPDYVEQDGKPGTRSLELNNPVYRVRIVRNKDIVYEGVMPPGLKLRFDNTVLTFREPSRWVRFRFVRDLGIPVAASGALCLLLGVAFLGLGAVRARAGKP